MEKVFAQSVTIGGQTISSPFTLPPTISELISKAILIIFPLAGVGLLLMIISAGFELMTSAGDAKKMESGKNRLTYAIVGFLIIFIAYWIVELVGIAFGIPSIKEIFGGKTENIR